MNDPSTTDHSTGPPDGQLYLVDKSAWAQRRHHPAANQRINDLATTAQAATCLPAALEYLYSARTLVEFDDQREALSLLVWLPATPAVEAAAVDIIAVLARKGQHRIPIPGLTIAATAMIHGAVVLHYDRDFERIAEVTDLRQEWIVPRGHGHGRTPE